MRYWSTPSTRQPIGAPILPLRSWDKGRFPAIGSAHVAAMFPPDYTLRVIDMNTGPLTDSDLEWADIVFTSTMIVQRVSLQDVIDRCNRAGVPVVAGGPHPTTFHNEIRGVDHFVLDEVEETFSGFLEDLESGVAGDIYRARRRPDVSKTPVPRFDLINLDNYHSMGVQFSRGCPFDCEFCDITKLYGRIPRTKSPDQMVAEFEQLYQLGWRGQVFLVDDNFIGNKRDAMNVLPALTEWQKSRGYPFTLCTEATINLVRLDALMDAMVDAGFDTVFIGIETPQSEGADQDPRNSRTPARRRTTSSSMQSGRSSGRGCRSRAGSFWAWMRTTKACSMPRSSSSRIPGFRWRQSTS